MWSWYNLNPVCYKRRDISKFHPRTGHESPEGELGYSSTLSLTSALDGGAWSTSLPGRFTPGKEPAPFILEAGWATEPFWTDAGNLTPTRIRPPDRTARSESPFRLRYPSPPCSWNLSCIKVERICPVGNGLNISALFLHRPCLMHTATQSGGVIRRPQTTHEACHMLISLKQLYDLLCQHWPSDKFLVTTSWRPSRH